MTQRVKLRRIQIKDHSIYGYRVLPYSASEKNDVHSYLKANHPPFAIIGYIGKYKDYSDIVGHCDAVYDLESLHLVAWPGMPRKEWKNLINICCDKEFFWLCYYGVDYIPLVMDPLPSIERDENSFYLNIPIDIPIEVHGDHIITKSESKCRCSEKLQETRLILYKIIKDQLSETLIVDSIKYHPVYVYCQQPDLTNYFRQVYWYIPGDHNNMILCSDEYPTLLIS